MSSESSAFEKTHSCPLLNGLVTFTLVMVEAMSGCTWALVSCLQVADGLAAPATASPPPMEPNATGRHASTPAAEATHTAEMTGLLLRDRGDGS